MENLTRRQLLQAGAAGTVAAGISAVAGPAAAGASPAKVGGIHIHANLDQTEGPVGIFKRLLDVTVFGPDDNLGGQGIDCAPDANNPNLPADPDVTQCLFTARGSVQGDAVRLVGRVILSTESHDNGAHVTTEANMTTGRIKWTFAHGPMVSVFEGTGLVARI